MSPVRLLVVDDFEPWRRFIFSQLHEQLGLRIIDEACDGVEAVVKAGELQPDLILLDIGLPKLNGIEAARQIRELAPQSKILFVSRESSSDVIQEAFRVGAQGYVLKGNAESDLLAAVNQIIAGTRFLSGGWAAGNLPLPVLAPSDNEL